MIKIGIFPGGYHFAFQWKHKWHYHMRVESQQPSTCLSAAPSLACLFLFVLFHKMEIRVKVRRWVKYKERRWQIKQRMFSKLLVKDLSYYDCKSTHSGKRNLDGERQEKRTRNSTPILSKAHLCGFFLRICQQTPQVASPSLRLAKGE